MEKKSKLVIFIEVIFVCYVIYGALYGSLNIAQKENFKFELITLINHLI